MAISFPLESFKERCLRRVLTCLKPFLFESNGRFAGRGARHRRKENPGPARRIGSEFISAQKQPEGQASFESRCKNP
jgi:hypothetical protein